MANKINSEQKMNALKEAGTCNYEDVPVWQIWQIIDENSKKWKELEKGVT